MLANYAFEATPSTNGHCGTHGIWNAACCLLPCLRHKRIEGVLWTTMLSWPSCQSVFAACQCYKVTLVQVIGLVLLGTHQSSHKQWSLAQWAWLQSYIYPDKTHVLYGPRHAVIHCNTLPHCYIPPHLSVNVFVHHQATCRTETQWAQSQLVIEWI